MKPHDRVFLARANELAMRGIGNTSPNPPVGAVIARHDTVIGEGFHHCAGKAHAEIEALRAARERIGVTGDLTDATLYVSLEPCNHAGRTPPCTEAIVQAGIRRVVVGTIDPNRQGIQRLRDAGVEVELANDAMSLTLVEIFTRAMRHRRSYLALKLAMSLDGFITSKPGVQEWITSEEERLYVRDLRSMHDAVMVGAGTVRVDDPQLTVRPPHNRVRPYYRIVVCRTASVPVTSRVFEPVNNYARTIVIAPASARDTVKELEGVADVLYVESEESGFLPEALRLLCERGVQSILCEGGPRLGAGLIQADAVDRCYWAIAPRFLTNNEAVPVLSGVNLAQLQRKLHVDRIERTGPDVILSGVF